VPIILREAINLLINIKASPLQNDRKKCFLVGNGLAYQGVSKFTL